MTDRRFLAAQKLLVSITAEYPQFSKAYYLLGEAQFRMGRYEQSGETFSKLILHNPDDVMARQRRWAVWLAKNPEDAQKRNEVSLAVARLERNAGQNAQQWYGVYLGYRYLRDITKRLASIKTLVPLTGDGPWRANVVDSLLTEILAQRDAIQRVALAALYLDYFSREPRAALVTKLLVKGIAHKNLGSDAFNRLMTVYLRRYPKNCNLYKEFARVLILRNSNLERAAKLLAQQQYWCANQSWKTAMGPDSGNPAVYPTENRFLLGVMNYRLGLPDDARRSLEGVGQQNRNYAQAQRFLAKIAEHSGRLERAIEYYRKALEWGVAGVDTQQQLSKLLKKQYDFTGHPQDYFYSDSAVRFTNVSRLAGLADVKAQRIAWGDFNNDGLEDFILNGPRLYQNQGDGTFKETTAAMGLKNLRGFNGGIWGDIDNDGWLDLLLTHAKQNRLLHNIKGLRFQDISSTVFVEPATGPTEAAAWGDINNDGRLDLFTANYEINSVELGICTADHLYLNQGNGRLKEISVQAGIISDEPMCGRGVQWLDHNNDGRQDILVSNYRLDPNQFWINQGNGLFLDEAEKYGVRGHNVSGAFGHSIGSASGDIDNDGEIDLFIANLAHPRYLEFSDQSMLLINSGFPDFEFNDTFTASGIRYEETTSDPLLFDVDNDGDLDLYFTSIYRGRRSYLYRNEGDGQFTDISWMSGTRVSNAWGAAYADYDNDGDLDLLVTSGDGVRLLRNEGNSNNWLSIRIRSDKCNRFGVGSIVRLTDAHTTQTRTVTAGNGTGTQNSLNLHFGLGKSPGPITLHINTLCGNQQSYTLNTVNQYRLISDRMR